VIRPRDNGFPGPAVAVDGPELVYIARTGRCLCIVLNESGDAITGACHV